MSTQNRKGHANKKAAASQAASNKNSIGPVGDMESEVNGIVKQNGAVAPTVKPEPKAEGGTNEQPNLKEIDDSTDPNELANTKEKTPMCLINELVRYNKIQHKYTLMNEQGPAHKKTFYVKLEIGEENYSSSGPSIKKAQHAAATIALDKTRFKHPPPKPISNNPVASKYTDSITPTVELNALAMKRGEPAVYRPLEVPHPPSGHYYPPPYHGRGYRNYNNSYGHSRYPRVLQVSLKVGRREFLGEGNTRQAARHAAAEKALKVLRHLPLPNQSVKQPQPNAEEVEGPKKSQQKSEISHVHEMALKRNLEVSFEVIREAGPPHIRTFVTKCTVGEFTTEGKGNGKKISKKKAAEAMLEQLQEFGPLPTTAVKPKKNNENKKKNKELMKAQKADPTYGVGINPISRLLQIQEAKQDAEPVYSLLAEKGMPPRREYVIQCQIGELVVSGVGPNKKLAKRSAAESMLQCQGYNRVPPQPSKSAFRAGEGQASADKKVTFSEGGGSQNRQPVPGILMMPDGTFPPQMSDSVSNNGKYNMENQQLNMNRSPGNQYQQQVTQQPPRSMYSPQTAAVIAQELLEKACSPTGEALVKAGVSPPPGSTSTSNPVQQLTYLADILQFQIQFTDFPKGNSKEILSLVSMSTNPTQVTHGSGLTVEDSRTMGCLTALRNFAAFGMKHMSEQSNMNLPANS